ncbi:MAG: hopanoid-associated phosphorylase [Proteobacteria bacterium]|nr:hopanoid-associated phosphorylase [Pseudomonadota bacterium]
MTVLAVTGLRREARLLAGPRLEVIASGGDARHLETTLEDRAAHVSGIISMGIAGALAPDLRPGQWVVAKAVLDRGQALPADPAWTRRLTARLSGAAEGTFVGADAMVAEKSEKAALHRATGAIAVDMESHVAARIAARRRLPFAAARVICDPAHRTLPPAARVGLRPDGRMDVLAVLRSLIGAPGQVPDLVRTAWEAEHAFRALLRGHRLLGAGLVGPDLA